MTAPHTTPTDADHKRTFAHFIARGGSCSAITNQDLPCAHHGDRLVDGKWLCHIHDPNGTFQRSLRRNQGDPDLHPDVDGQMFFSDIVDHGAALFAPPSKEAARIAGKRARSFVKWEDSL